MGECRDLREVEYTVHTMVNWTSIARTTSALSALAILFLGSAIDLGAPAQAKTVCEERTQSLKIEGAITRVYKAIAGADLRLYVFDRADHSPSEKRAAIVFFFGGGWVDGGVDQFVPQSKYLANRGMVAIVADYRVRCRYNSTPLDSIADARLAIHWIRMHAAELGIDSGRIAAGGGSAGGHIALSSAVFERKKAGGSVPDSATPDALVLFNPIIDLTSEFSQTKLLRENFGAAVSDRAEEISPLQHIHQGLPPTLILNGEADTIAPYVTAEKYCRNAIAMGNDCRLIGYEGAGHGFFNPDANAGKWYRPTLLEADRFLTSIGYLPSPSSAAMK
jgi:acetyl esterase/lipase